jgi:hypothetical protein
VLHNFLYAFRSTFGERLQTISSCKQANTSFAKYAALIFTSLTQHLDGTAFGLHAVVAICALQQHRMQGKFQSNCVVALHN